MVELLCKKSYGIDIAYILGEVEFLGDLNVVILVVRNWNAVTIEFRRKSQTITEKSLNVVAISKYPCLF